MEQFSVTTDDVDQPIRECDTVPFELKRRDGRPLGTPLDPVNILNAMQPGLSLVQAKQDAYDKGYANGYTKAISQAAFACDQVAVGCWDQCSSLSNISPSEAARRCQDAVGKLLKDTG